MGDFERRERRSSRRWWASVAAAVLVLSTGLIALASADANEAQASPATTNETIRSLSEKVRKLSSEVSALKLSVVSLERGTAGLSLPTQATYGRLRMLESKVGTICRDRQLVSSVIQSSDGRVIARYVQC